MATARLRSAVPGHRLVPPGGRFSLGSRRCCSHMAEASTTPSLQPAQQPSSSPETVVQYIVLRRDLWGPDMKWPLGSVVAQACHASSAAMWQFRDDASTQQYLADGNIDSMHKVVLEVKGEGQLRELADRLGAAGILHKLWVEKPEDIPTCLATKPYPKSHIAPHLKKLQLCKTALGQA
ncbi:peptidyl-tRNA hydrolase II family protein [Haematococcus lacustris]